MFNINRNAPNYDPESVQPMRDELTFTGFQELLSASDVDKFLSNENSGTVLVFINSVCGCAAGSARPGVNLALQNKVIPDHITTVFAGMEKEAVARVREYMKNIPPSSPFIALFKNGKPVYAMQRFEIEGRGPEEISADLVDQFNEHCIKQGPSIPAEKFAQLEYGQFCGSKIPRIS